MDECFAETLMLAMKVAVRSSEAERERLEEQLATSQVPMPASHAMPQQQPWHEPFCFTSGLLAPDTLKLSLTAVSPLFSKSLLFVHCAPRLAC